MCLICRFIVMKNSTTQYMSRIGQNTGTSKKEKNVIQNAMQNAFVHEYLHASRIPRMLY
jgi:hypothetical protein